MCVPSLPFISDIFYYLFIYFDLCWQRNGQLEGSSQLTVSHSYTQDMSRKPGLIQPTGLNYLNRTKDSEGEDGGEKEVERRVTEQAGPSQSTWLLVNLFKKKKPSILGFTPILFSSTIFSRSYFLPLSHLLILSFLHPPPTIFHSVYLSTFTVTALESQESKLAPSLSFRRSGFMPLCPFPAFSITLVEIHINLCIGGMEGPRYSPSRQQALSFSSHAQPFGYPALIYSHTRGRTLALMSNINLLTRQIGK